MSTRERVLEHFQSVDRATAREIAAATGIPHSTIRGCCLSMARVGELGRDQYREGPRSEWTYWIPQGRAVSKPPTAPVDPGPAPQHETRMRAKLSNVELAQRLVEVEESIARLQDERAEILGQLGG